ncbi:MAG TPA: TetR/AcrR family transcriptional regulator [Kofleriaceae bacterium]|nr:TetR/AcrR family transcriptional regulator [Kofleriaceae bacterium]
MDAILSATARVLVRHGYDDLTTNAVATAAGVSIGSLYQYFPNKTALVAALLDRHIEDMNAAVLAELTRVAQLPLAEASRCVVELTIRAHAVDPELHRVLTEQVPRVGKLARLRELDEICHRMVAGLLAARKDELAIRDPDLAAFVLVSTIEAIVHRAALLYPHRLRDPRLIDETTLLVTRYLGLAAN